jgi:ABC-type branched-subunit amino acid transport system substrate-binding protein
VATNVQAAERTRQAIAAAEAGDIADARALLAEALELDSGYELAWLWFAAVAEDPAEEKFCLERARDLDPNHQVSPALARLRGIEASCPHELITIIDPPPPEFLSGYVAQARDRRRRKIWTRTLATLLAIAMVAGLIGLIAASRQKYTYLALVVSDSTPGQLGGQEVTEAAQAAVDTWNETRATSATQLRLVTFVDDGQPEKARAIAEQIVDDGRFVGVIGHMLSTTSLAAAPVYAAAGIPAITPMATADAVTADNPWYFRTVFDNAQQGRGVAVYVSGVLKRPQATVVSTDDPYGTSLRESFVEAYRQLGDLRGDVVISSDPARLDAELDRAATEIATVGDPGIVALLTLDPASSALATKLKERGITTTFVGPDALASTTFYEGLLDVSPALVNDSLTATPLTEGTLTGEAVTFYDTFAESLDFAPGWAAGLTYDAVDAFAESMVRGGILWGEDDVAGARTIIRDVLDSARDAETSLPVLTGPLWFEPGNSAARNVSFEDGRIAPDGRITLASAGYQLSPYAPTIGVTLPQEIRDGTAVSALGEVYTIQRVVTTGFNINEIQDLSPGTQTFTADFFIWFTFRGEGEGPTQVTFANSVDRALGLGEPLRKSLSNGVYYELYRVRGSFRAQMDFADFPFDSQRLPIVVQNASLPAVKITYVPDQDNLEQSQEQRLQSGVNASATIDQIPNWQADAVQFYPMSVGASGDLGDPSIAAGSGGITFSQMVTANLISRDVTSFLIKNLLPLILLSMVTYVALWYPYKDATARISFGVTGILTGAVMLNSVTSSLPAVDYTVAIQWAYYAFILLSGLCVLGALIGRQLTESRQLARVRVLDRVMRIGYPAFILSVVAAYALTF